MGILTKNVKLTAIIMFIMVFSGVIPADDPQEKSHDKIVETMEVVNIEIPVRVFYKDKSIKGMKKEDFELYSDGQKCEINGFYEMTKKLENTSAQSVQEPRLFVLIFNIGSYNDDLEKGIDIFFKQMIRPKDRIILLTNNYSLSERVVDDPQQEMERIKKMLRLESRDMRRKLEYIESQMEYLANTLKFEAKSSQTGKEVSYDPEQAIKRFLQGYEENLEEYKKLLFNPREDLYVKISEYLKKRDLAKWVIHFYQVPEFLVLKENEGEISKFIEQYFKGKRQLNPYTFELLKKMNIPDQSRSENIARIFLNTGAAFHTMLAPCNNSKYFLEYEYRPITVDSEHITRQITQLTHGVIENSVKMDKFIKKITSTEDVSYMLTYAPKGGVDRTLKRDIKIQVKNKKYSVVYDNQQRPGYIGKIQKEVENEMQKVRFSEVEIADGTISSVITGIVLAPFTPENGEEAKKNVGRLILNIKILNSNGQTISTIKKAFLSKADKAPIKLRLPILKKGNYQLIFEVNDFNSGENDLSFNEFAFASDLILEPGQEAYQFLKPVEPIKIETAVSTGAVEDEPQIDEIDADSALGQGLESKFSSSVSKESIDQSKLPKILEQIAHYCSRLEVISLNFYCSENIEEKAVNKIQSAGKLLKKKIDVVEKLKYGYRLIKDIDTGKITEQRLLIERNGWKHEEENASLQTRFKYKYIIFGPSTFNKASQGLYNYEIVEKRSWNEKNVWVVEATPKSAEKSEFVSGRFWVDEVDYSILRIEIYQQSIGNFAEVEKSAREYKVEPKFTIINEYEIVKNGIRFPSRLYYEEAYKNRDGRIMVQARTNVVFSDYTFFTVDTKVSY